MPSKTVSPENAFNIFRKTSGRPTFIVLDSHIGYGSPHKQDTAEAHGEPLGDDEVRLAKKSYGWPEDAKFLVPDEVYEHFSAALTRAVTKLGRIGLRFLPPIARSISSLPKK